MTSEACRRREARMVLSIGNLAEVCVCVCDHMPKGVDNSIIPLTTTQYTFGNVDVFSKTRRCAEYSDVPSKQ